VNKMETRCGELQLELEQSKAALENTSNTETEIKYDLEHSAITNAELRSKNRNLQLEIEYLKHHVEVFKTDFEEQIRQLQTEAGKAFKGSKNLRFSHPHTHLNNALRYA
jgi:predicted RNase H-like nuclease (RuvC/YqgF family)